MKVRIVYCGACGYERRARLLAGAIRTAKGIDCELVVSGGGVFDVFRDDTLIFSRHVTSRFPEEAEILDALD